MRPRTLLLWLSAGALSDGVTGPAAAAPARAAAAVSCVRVRDDALLCGDEVFQRVARTSTRGRSLQASRQPSDNQSAGWEGAAEEILTMVRKLA